jgi:hypothetical protein
MRNGPLRTALLLYGVSLVVFGLLTGRHPFTADLAQLIEEHTQLRRR